MIKVNNVFILYHCYSRNGENIESTVVDNVRIGGKSATKVMSFGGNDGFVHILDSQIMNTDWVKMKQYDKINVDSTNQTYYND